MFNLCKQCGDGREAEGVSIVLWGTVIRSVLKIGKELCRGPQPAFTAFLCAE